MASASQCATNSSFTNLVSLTCSQPSVRPSTFAPPSKYSLHSKPSNHGLHIHRVEKIGAQLDEQSASIPLPGQSLQPNLRVDESVKVLKEAAKTKKVPKEVILSAFSVIEKAKVDPSKFLDTLGGTKSPGRTWMLVFTAEKQSNSGVYFPLTAIQRFDAAGMRIENGVYLGPVGALTFEGRISWKNRILAFVFESIRIKVGPLKPFEISLGKKDDAEPSTKDPFFIWFYVDEEIAVARGKSGGTAFWCRCQRVIS